MEVPFRKLNVFSLTSAGNYMISTSSCGKGKEVEWDNARDFIKEWLFSFQRKISPELIFEVGLESRYSLSIAI